MIITISLRKGGSGKTTTAVNLAAALHQHRRKVVLVDLDPQANATLSVGVDPLTCSQTIDTLFRDASSQAQDMIIQTPFGLPLLPGHPDLAESEAGMNARQVGILRGILEPLQPLYDFVIVDTPPSESLLTVNALAAAQLVIIPLQAHFLAMRGLSDQLTEIEQVKRGLNPGLEIAGILITMLARTNIGRLVAEQVRAAHGALVYPFEIPHSVRFVESSLAGRPLVVQDPEHPGALAYTQLAETFTRKGGKRATK